MPVPFPPILVKTRNNKNYDSSIRAWLVFLEIGYSFSFTGKYSFNDLNEYGILSSREHIKFWTRNKPFILSGLTLIVFFILGNYIPVYSADL